MAVGCRMPRICRTRRRSMPMAMAASASPACRTAARCCACRTASGPGRSASVRELTEAALAPVFERAGALDLFLIGAGRDPYALPDAVAGAFRALSIAVDCLAHRAGGADLQYPAGRKAPRRRRTDRGRLNPLDCADADAISSIAPRWCARPTGIAISPRCSRRPTHRDALFALYAFNVEIARVRELAREPMPGEIRLQWWREVLAGERDGEAAAHPVAAALRDDACALSACAAPLLDLIDARAFDLYDEPMATLTDLESYAHQDRSRRCSPWPREFSAAAATPAELLTLDAGIAYAIAGHAARLRACTRRAGSFMCRSICCSATASSRDEIFAGQARASRCAPRWPSCARWRAGIWRRRKRSLTSAPPESCRRCCRSRSSARRCAGWSGAAISRSSSSRRRPGAGNGAVARGARSEPDFQALESIPPRRPAARRQSSARDRRARGR